MKNICFAICVLSAALGSAQVWDDFSDGELLHDPAWVGSVNLFIVNDQQRLQLYAGGAGQACLATASTALQQAEWRCWVQLKFSPSANNQARIYLASDSEGLSGSLNGYFLQLGEAGSADAITLFRQVGDSIVMVCRGSEGLIASPFAISIRVIRQDSTWTVYADPAGGDNYRLEATGTDLHAMATAFAGIRCQYTSSNSDGMLFDNIYAGPVIIDSVAPTILDASTNGRQVDLLFSETLDPATAATTSNYQLDHGLGPPASAWLDNDDPATVHLLYDPGLPGFDNYKLTIVNVCDPAGNCMAATMVYFAYFLPGPFGIIITEIMADPGPGLALPPHEYIELFNPAPFPASLDGWVFWSGNSAQVISGAVVPAGAHLILCGESSASSLSPHGPVHGLPAFSLPNTGQSLRLYDAGGNLMAAVDYDDSWYGDVDKAGGGWSLELINTHNPCAGEGNWKASCDPDGGTPGRQNSVSDDREMPVLMEKACYVNDSTVAVYFNQLMDGSSLLPPTAWQAGHGMEVPFHVMVDTPVTSRAVLVFNDRFRAGMTYALQAGQEACNCVGTSLEPFQEARLGVPEEPQYNDLVINEILFNPLGGGVDYVELYNRSGRVIELSGMKLASVRSAFPNPDDTIARDISGACRLCFPGDYLLLSPDGGTVRSQYHSGDGRGFIDMNSFPSYNNDEGRVLLLDVHGAPVDQFHYHESMHHPLLVSAEGVSLERLHYDRSSDDATNWHSAAAQAGFGTPGYENSQFRPVEEQGNPLRLEPEIIFPDNYSGDNSILFIFYDFDQPGNIANVFIFNIQGHVIRKLVQNGLLGARGSFSWNGMDERDLPVPPGIYIVLVEIFDVRGKVQRYKEPAVVGRR